jgi:cytochrome c peroxidase
MSSVAQAHSLQDEGAGTPLEVQIALSNKPNAIRGLNGHQRMMLHALRITHYLVSLGEKSVPCLSRSKIDLRHGARVKGLSMRTLPAEESRMTGLGFAGSTFLRVYKRRLISAGLVTTAALVIIAAVSGQQLSFIPNGALFANPGGASQTYSTAGKGIDLTGPFFQSLGRNGRSCATCHQPSDGMSISAASVEARFSMTRGEDPIFRTVDGSNCDHSVDVSTLAGKYAAYSLLRTRGLIRVAIAVPANADYQVMSVNNQYGCNESDVISMYRRPLPSTNLRFQSSVMFDGRESSPATGTTKIQYANYPSSLLSDLAHQSVDATTGHAQGDGTRPTPAEQQEIVNFEMGLFTAQAIGSNTGRLDARGANGGPKPLVTHPFFVSVNSSVHFLLPQHEQPGGLLTAGDGQFTPAIFDTFGAWADLPPTSPRAAVARGEAIFNSKPIHITDVAGINDDVSAGGLVPGGIPMLEGTCGTCHDTPNVGNHSFPTPLNIGTGDPSATSLFVNKGGLDTSYLPNITVCRKDPATGGPTTDCKTTTDLGQALVDGKFDHVGKIKGPILRGISARAPYFHNGSAQTLMDVVHFYEKRFELVLTPQEESDLVAFLAAL